MINSYVRVMHYALCSFFMLPALWYLSTVWRGMYAFSALTGLVLTALGVALTIFSGRWLQKLRPALEARSMQEAKFVDSLDTRWISVAIVASAAASLALELALIRWQGTVWEVFAFYKNFTLLACFAGLGLGYALARRDWIPLMLVVPLLALQGIFLTGLRLLPGYFQVQRPLLMPVAEQLNMGTISLTDWRELIVVYPFLSGVFLLTVLAFLPLGQLCGRLLDRRPQLQAYGLNLLGSLIGVLLMLGLSYFWTPPAVWFFAPFLVLLGLQPADSSGRIVWLVAMLVTLAALDIVKSPGIERTYSPYQLLDRGQYGPRNLTIVTAAGHYYQRVHDLSPEAVQADESLLPLARYYELPCGFKPKPASVAVVGAGTGNDVAAALRKGAKHVDAIEIDPAIVRIGKLYHPEHPYSDPRVNCIVNDARTFLRSTTNRYDLIVYGLLDSHTLLSHASSVRLDSFVYTVEGLREARARLEDDGVVSLSFCVLSPEIGRKIFLMMQEAFDGVPPVCISAKYDGSIVFAQSKRGDLQIDPDLLKDTAFEDQSTLYGNPNLRADVSTDDWPFFYMPRRVYPISYVGMVLLVLLITIFLTRSFVGERPRFSHARFFFLGAGFMLVETKGITELGLIFGNTWQVIGIAIAAILVMAYLANLAVAWLRVQQPTLSLILVVGSLAIGLTVAKFGGVPGSVLGQFIAVTLLTCPMFFAGIAFSSQLTRTEEVSAALGLNLFGAMFGGLLEYNSMYFGFQFLYWLAIFLYIAALLADFPLRPVKR